MGNLFNPRSLCSRKSDNWQILTSIPTHGSASAFDYVELAGITDFSPFMMHDDRALAVNLASFQATPDTDQMLVTWETVSELDNLGFNLYRFDKTGTSEVPVTWTTQLNPSLIPAQAPGSGQGAAYEWHSIQ